MIYKLILLQFIGHLFSDFICQPHKWSLEKKRGSLTIYHAYHILVVFLFSFLFSLDLKFWWAALLLTASHLIIDALKGHLDIKAIKTGKKRNLFFADQFLHITFIVLISLLYQRSTGISFAIDIPVNALLVSCAFIFCAKPANILIKNIFIAFSIKTPAAADSTEYKETTDDESLPNAGKLIGIMERFLVLALVLIGQFSAVGLIIAAKSILRFRSTVRNEYILVGTLLSFGIAVLLGILISQVLLST
jgi:hypothetical protein